MALQTGTPHLGTSIAVGDYDLDGWVDLFVADWHTTNGLGSPVEHNRLLHNLGPAAPGYYEDVTIPLGIDLTAASVEVGAPPGAHGFAPAFVDLDDDGWPELAIAVDYGP